MTWINMIIAIPVSFCIVLVVRAIIKEYITTKD